MNCGDCDHELAPDDAIDRIGAYIRHAGNVRCVELLYEDRDSVRELLRPMLEAAKKATPGPWHPAQFNSKTDEEAVAYFKDMVALGDGPIWGACVPLGDGTPVEEEALYPAVTGNGPTSEANMEHVAATNPTNIIAVCRALGMEVKS